MLFGRYCTFVDDFELMRSAYLSTDDKTTTKLYLHIERYGSDMSVVKLNGRSNVETRVAEYRSKWDFEE